MSDPLVLKDREWQLEDAPGQVRCWSTVIGGVLCRWWGTEEPPGHKDLIDITNLRTRLAESEEALHMARSSLQTTEARLAAAEAERDRERAIHRKAEDELGARAQDAYDKRDAALAALTRAGEECRALRAWRAAYGALSSGRTAQESNALEMAYNAACEQLWEATGDALSPQPPAEEMP